MNNPRMIAPFFLFMFVLAGVCAAENRDDYQALDRTHAGYRSTLTGGVVGVSAAKVDSVDILGGSLDGGDFQDALGNPDEEGWTHVDLTVEDPSQWHISDFNAANLDLSQPGNQAWWCGRSYFQSCGTSNYEGYGNDWNENLTWAQPVFDPLNPTNVDIMATINVDTEPGADQLQLQHWDENQGQWVSIADFEGQLSAYSVHEWVTIMPNQLTGPSLDELHLRWNFKSDHTGSDEDCLYPTMGGAQIDRIHVLFESIEVTYDDCDNTPDNWTPEDPVGVGDFAQVVGMLEDLDYLRSNYTPQFVFVDDGTVVPGTGGTFCLSYCYYPGGYVVNSDGGLAGPEFGIHNEIRSPIVEWPLGNFDGGRLALDLYMHLPNFSGNPDIYFYWRVRSTDGDPWTIVDAVWRTDGMLYYGSNPHYMRFEQDLTPYLVPGRTAIQIALGVYEKDVDRGVDASPAPYIDNVRLTAFEFAGPAIVAREGHLAQDNFPDIGLVDYLDLGANSVRFDMARNISPPDHVRNDPGDSIVCMVSAVTPGSALIHPPLMYYKLNPNPLFDPYRISGFPNEGAVMGDSCVTGTGVVLEDRFYFDLPDQDFLFPGDVLHYYIEATDVMSLSTAILPADTTGYGDFSFESQYPVAFEMRALPTVNTSTPGDHPPILVINDNPGRGVDNEWDFALAGYGYLEGQDFDLYRVKESASGLGNGIGGRATPPHLEGYQSILYTCGDLDQYTISNGDFAEDPSDDVGTLDAWLQLGNKNLMTAGDNLVWDLNQSGAATVAFSAGWLGVNLIAKDASPFLGGNFTPEVDTLGIGPPVISDPVNWDLLGSDPVVHTFDAVAAFCSPGQFLKFPAEGPPYSMSAGTYHQESMYSNQIISLPYGLASVLEPPINKFNTDNSLRGRLLREFLYLFGHFVDPGLARGIPDLDLSTAWTMTGNPVMVHTRPNAGGYGLETAMEFGQVEINATIFVNLLDELGVPIEAFPKEDVWLESISGDFAFCVGGTMADDDSDPTGTTTFTKPLSGGGHSLDYGADAAVVMVNGYPLNGMPLDIYFNSPDINGDLMVDMVDMAEFAFDYYFPDPGPLRSDFFWDGTINLSDLILFANGYGEDCWTSDPFDPTPLPSVNPLPAATVELFFDPAGTQKVLEVNPGITFDVYVILTPVAPVDVGGFAYRLLGDPFIPTILSHPNQSVATISNAPDLETGYTECVPSGTGTPTIMDQMTMILLAPGSFELSAAAIPGRYPVVTYGDCGGRLCFDMTVGPPIQINPVDPGVVIVDPEPDAANAPWELTWSSGSLSAWGDTTLHDMDPGSYTLVWEDAGPNWFNPVPNTVMFELAEGDTVTVTGTYHTPIPNLLSIIDVPNDQGRNVRMIWERSYFDVMGSDLPVAGYGIYRRQDEYKAQDGSLAKSKPGPLTATDKLLGWDFLTTVPAHGDSIYQYVAPTLCDSTDIGICWTTFFIRVMTDDPYTYYDSDELLGYSVDNLFPSVPQSLQVAYMAGGNTLTWEENPDPDVKYYKVYRADISHTTFPGGDPVAQVTNPGWFDDLSGAVGSAWSFCYFVSAVDFNGNEGDATLWADTEVSGTEDNPLPRAFALLPCYPNPFNPCTTIGFDLPHALPVTLEIFDVSGRLVRVLAGGKTLPPGRHEVVWDGQDDRGRMSAAGIYLYRLQAGDFSETKRMALVK